MWEQSKPGRSVTQCLCCHYMVVRVDRGPSPEGLQQDSEVCLTPGEPCLSARPPAVWKDKISHWQCSWTQCLSCKTNIVPLWKNWYDLQLQPQEPSLTCFMFAYFRLRLPVCLWWCEQGPSTYQCWLRLRLFPSSPWGEAFSGNSKTTIWNVDNEAPCPMQAA